MLNQGYPLFERWCPCCGTIVLVNSSLAFDASDRAAQIAWCHEGIRFYSYPEVAHLIQDLGPKASFIISTLGIAIPKRLLSSKLGVPPKPEAAPSISDPPQPKSFLKPAIYHPSHNTLLCRHCRAPLFGAWDKDMEAYDCVYCGSYNLPPEAAI